MVEAVPETLETWTLEAIQRLVHLGREESDRFDFKEFLEPDATEARSKHRRRLRQVACSFANAQGGFLVFGVSDRGQGDARLVGIPPSGENASRLQDKLDGIEPSIHLSAREPIPLPNGRVLFVAAIPRGRHGPYWDPNEKKFVTRGQGTTRNMTYREIQMAFIDHAERVGRIKLTYLSLIDNWQRLESIATQADGGPFVLPNVESASIRSSLGDVQALRPDLIIHLLEVIRELDAIAERCNHMRVASHIVHAYRNDILDQHRREVRSTIPTLRDRVNWLLKEFKEAFGFEEIVDRQGRRMPPLTF